jgi:hypothetical protein
MMNPQPEMMPPVLDDARDRAVPLLLFVDPRDQDDVVVLPDGDPQGEEEDRYRPVQAGEFRAVSDLEDGERYPEGSTEASDGRLACVGLIDRSFGGPR